MTYDFFGPNYTVSNVVYDGSPNAVGSFNADSTNLGLSSGIIMTTGTVSCEGSNGPCGPNNSGGAGIDNNIPGSAYISALNSGADSYNASLFEFDIVSTLDTLKFNFVFGSDEYPEYAGSQFADAFAVYLAGPGIPGLINIARAPNGQHVSVNTINPATNSAYYVYNGDGSNTPYSADDTYIQYDGFTKPLKIEEPILAGEAYHVIMVIADAGDGILDSGVFIEKCDGCDTYVSIDETDQEGIKCYPNPANKVVNIESPVNGDLIVFNSLGQAIRTDLVKAGETTLVNDLPQGVYYFTIVGDNYRWQEKVIVLNQQ
jgi:hypothetical protein